MARLTQAQLGGFRRDGFVLVPGVVPRALVEAAAQAILGFVGADLGRPDTWYRADPRAFNVVPLHHPQAFWDVRQHPALHEVFAAITGTERLWVTMDRGRFKPPRSKAHPHDDDNRIHWDVDPRKPESRALLQGLVYLSDAPEGLGPFECVPSLFRELPAWLERNEVNEALQPDLDGREVVQVPGRAGDLVVWRAWLPHDGAPNLGTRPRLSLSVAMGPEGSEAERQERVQLWAERRAPQCWRGWPTQLDPEPGHPAELTGLGRRLLGLDRWPDQMLHDRVK